jgi:AcrB/AcrD/AcrF family
LFGIAILNGIVMVSYMEERRKTGLAAAAAAWQAAMTRLRPVLMTATVARLGFLPTALSTNSGAEVQRPLATVVIGGLISATLLTYWCSPPSIPGFVVRALPFVRPLAMPPMRRSRQNDDGEACDSQAQQCRQPVSRVARKSRIYRQVVSPVCAYYLAQLAV